MNSITVHIGKIWKRLNFIQLQFILLLGTLSLSFKRCSCTDCLSSALSWFGTYFPVLIFNYFSLHKGISTNNFPYDISLPSSHHYCILLFSLLFLLSHSSIFYQEHKFSSLLFDPFFHYCSLLRLQSIPKECVREEHTSVPHLPYLKSSHWALVALFQFFRPIFIREKLVLLTFYTKCTPKPFRVL